MRRSPRKARAVGFACLVSASMFPGCGGEAVPPDQAASTPVFNPSPDNPLKDVTLQNESQYKDKIGGIPK